MRDLCLLGLLTALVGGSTPWHRLAQANHPQLEGLLPPSTTQGPLVQTRLGTVRGRQQGDAWQFLGLTVMLPPTLQVSISISCDGSLVSVSPSISRRCGRSMATRPGDSMSPFHGRKLGIQQSTMPRTTAPLPADSVLCLCFSLTLLFSQDCTAFNLP